MMDFELFHPKYVQDDWKALLPSLHQKICQVYLNMHIKNTTDFTYPLFLQLLSQKYPGTY